MGMDRKLEKKKWPLKRILKLAAAVLFLIIILYLLIFKNYTTSLNVKRERITISTVKKGLFKEFIPTVGTVQPLNTHELSADEGGRVEAIYLEAGSKVKKGEKILKLANTSLMMTILNNEAQISRASNDLRATRLQLERNRLELKKQMAESDYFLLRIKRTYERNKVLFKEKMISRQTYEESKDEYEYLQKRRKLTIESQENDLKFQQEQVEQLEASVSRMQKNLELIKMKLENLIIKAPISGQLTSLSVIIGETVSQGQRLGQIDEEEGFMLEADIDEHYINRIQIGKVGQFEFSDTLGQVKVKRIYPEVVDNRFKVEMSFEKKEPEGIRRGLTLQIRLQLSDQIEALLLPRGGFYQVTGGNWVFVVDKSGNFATRRNIRIGRQNPDYFELLEGLEPEEKVITSSYENYTRIEELIIKSP